MNFSMYQKFPAVATVLCVTCFIVLSVTVCSVGYVCLFCGDQIFVDFVYFLSMIMYKVLYNYMMFKI